MQNAFSSCHSQVMWSNCKYITVTRQNQSFYSKPAGWVGGSIFIQLISQDKTLMSLSVHQSKSFSKQDLIRIQFLISHISRADACCHGNSNMGLSVESITYQIMTPPYCPWNSTRCQSIALNGHFYVTISQIIKNALSTFTNEMILKHTPQH